MSNGTGVRVEPDVPLAESESESEAESEAEPVTSAPARVSLRVLGTFEANVDGHPVPLGGPRQRAVLARVVVADGSTVPAEQIVEDVWGGTAGSTPSMVHVYVSRLRRALGGEAISRRAGGYLLDRGVVAVDAEAFETDVARGRGLLAKGDDEVAATVLEGALDRWVGPRAFGDLANLPFLEIITARLEELRVSAAETLADAHARRGRAAGDVALLEELAAHDPLRESLALRLVTALYDAGRQADALAAFERCRRSLADQLGVDPAPPLRRVHAAVLAQEAPTAAAAVGRRPPVNLPPRNRSFTGRGSLLAEVDRLLDDDSHRPRAVALSGLAGVGKTELALEVAYRRHREGRVAWWIVADDPAGTATGLADLAAAAGVPQYEREEDTREALWTELDRNPGWMIVFDNAVEPRELEPFLPAAQHGDVIITSHNPAWRRLARPIGLPPLIRAESVAFVTARSGDPDRAGADALAGLLGDLPLALEQACAYIEQTGMSIPDYVRLFQTRRANLLLGDRGGPGPTIATTWGLAFDRLRVRSALATTVLETAAFLAPDAIDVAVLAPLATDELDLNDAVGELLRLSLVDREGTQLRVHRLVQDVIRDRLPEPVRRERFAIAAGLCDAPSRGDDAGAAAWAAHLVVLAEHGEQLGMVPDRLVESLSALARRYAGRALYPAATQVLDAALRLIRVPAHAGPATAERQVQEGRLLCQLGEVLRRRRPAAEALQLHRDAVRMLQPVVGPDDVALAHAHNRLGHVLNCADDIEGAIVVARARVGRAGPGRTRRPAPAGAHRPGIHAVGRRPARTGRRGAAGRPGRADRPAAGATAGTGRTPPPGWAWSSRTAGSSPRPSATSGPSSRSSPGSAGPTTRTPRRRWTSSATCCGCRARWPSRWPATSGRCACWSGCWAPTTRGSGWPLTNLGLAYADADQPERAVQSQTRARAIFLAQLGPTHAHTLLAGRRLAVALARTDQPLRARALVEEVLADRRAPAGRQRRRARAGRRRRRHGATPRPVTPSWPPTGASGPARRSAAHWAPIIRKPAPWPSPAADRRPRWVTRGWIGGGE